MTRTVRCCAANHHSNPAVAGIRRWWTPGRARGAWLATVDDSTWERAGAERRAKAALDWHPRFGDRTQELAILSHEASPGAIVAALREALLTDDELAAGEAVWRDYPDPFGSWHTDPCDDLDIEDSSTLDNRKDRA